MKFLLCFVLVLASQVRAFDSATALDFLNQQRAQAQVCGTTPFNPTHPLVWNAQLAQAAQTHVDDMAQRNYFSHVSPEGGSMGQRIHATGYAYRAAGENIATAYGDSAEQVIVRWLNSPGHCANIMNPQFTDFALAYAPATQPGEAERWVAVFGAQFGQ